MSLRILACCIALLVPIDALAAAAANERIAIIDAVARGGRPAVDHAIGRLRFLGEPKDVLREIARLATNGNTRARQNATYVLEAVAPRGFTPVLLQAVEDEDPLVREQACKALGKLKERTAARALIRATGDSSPLVRREAILALGRIGDRSALRPLTAALKDPQPEPRLAAIVALGDLGDSRAAPKLLPLLEDPSELTRLAVARSLVMVGNAQGRKFAEQRLASEQPAERRDGIQIIEAGKANWARDALLRRLEDPELSVRIAAARALASRGDGRGVEWLVLAAEAADVEERLKLETAIESTGLTSQDRKKILANKRK